MGVTFLNTVFEARCRVKILKEAGLSYANVTIPYYDENNEEQIKKISAYTYSLDAAGNIKTTEVNKSSIYTKRINKQHSVMIIAFPDVKVGSVIEYKYTEERETRDISNWYFQEKIPTRYSEYQLNIPQAFHFTVQPLVVGDIETKEEIQDQNIAVNEGTLITKVLKKNYIMRNLPGIKNEPFMGSPKDYIQRLEFQISEIDYGDGEVVNIRKNWADLVKDLREYPDFGLQLDKQIPETLPFIAQVTAMPRAESRIKSVFDYVRKNLNWNGDENIFTDEGIVKAWKNKSGNNADINLLLVTLLKQAGIQAYPVLLSTRDNGLVNTFYPFFNQFNTVMAYAEAGDKIFVLDASDKISGFTLTPESIVNTRGFVVQGEKGKWIDVSDLNSKYRIMTAIHGSIDENGILKGDGTVNCDGYARTRRCKSWKKDKDKFREEFFVKPYNAVKVEDLVVNNADNDSLSLEQKVTFTYLLSNSGDYRNFSVNLFTGLDKNPFIADERKADVDFGILQEYMIFGNYSIPDGYSFDALPDNISMIMPDTSIVFRRFLQIEDNMLNVRISVIFKRTYFQAADYPDFAAFYKKMLGKLNEPVVIKKKKAP